MLRAASSSYCLEQSIIEMDQMLCELCCSSWPDSWVNVGQTAGQTDVVFIAKWEELFFWGFFTHFALSHSQNSSILLNSTMIAVTHLNCSLVRWQDTFLAWLRLLHLLSCLFESATFFMWSCLIHSCIIVIRPWSTFLLSHQVTFLKRLKANLSHHQLK